MNNESDYYQLLGSSWFVLTMRRGGWDAMRHYEIVAAGALPYFLDLERCPVSTLESLPKSALLQARHLLPNVSLHNVRAAYSALLQRRPDLGGSEGFLRM